MAGQHDLVDLQHDDLLVVQEAVPVHAPVIQPLVGYGAIADGCVAGRDIEVALEIIQKIKFARHAPRPQRIDQGQGKAISHDQHVRPLFDGALRCHHPGIGRRHLKRGIPPEVEQVSQVRIRATRWLHHDVTVVRAGHLARQLRIHRGEQLIEHQVDAVVIPMRPAAGE